MDDERPSAPAPADPVTIDSALGHATRLLLNAEMETNLPLMEHLADSWIAIARTLADRG